MGQTQIEELRVRARPPGTDCAAHSPPMAEHVTVRQVLSEASAIQPCLRDQSRGQFHPGLARMFHELLSRD